MPSVGRSHEIRSNLFGGFAIRSMAHSAYNEGLIC